MFPESFVYVNSKVDKSQMPSPYEAKEQRQHLAHTAMSYLDCMLDQLDSPIFEVNQTHPHLLQDF